MRNVIYVTVLLVTGCSTLPDTVAECSTLPDIYTTTAEIEYCEMKVLQNEDSQFKRRMEREKRNGCAWPLIWDGRWNMCKTPSMFIF